MSASLTPTQTLILWYLLGRGGSAWLMDIRPEPRTAKVWRDLERAGLVMSEKRHREARPTKGPHKSRGSARGVKNPRQTNSLWIEVTDAGWAWANSNLSSPVPAKTLSAGPILQAWLTRLHAFMERRGITLAEIVGAVSDSNNVDRETQTALETRIRQAYLQVTGGAWNQRVRLSDLRGLLGGVERSALDAALLKMQQAARLVLFRLDNQREITDEDRQAALLLGGEPRHVLRMES